jgi:hypothetical protein
MLGALALVPDRLLGSSKSDLKLLSLVEHSLSSQVEQLAELFEKTSFFLSKLNRFMSLPNPFVSFVSSACRHVLALSSLSWPSLPSTDVHSELSPSSSVTEPVTGDSLLRSSGGTKLMSECISNSTRSFLINGAEAPLPQELLFEAEPAGMLKTISCSRSSFREE